MVIYHFSLQISFVRGTEAIFIKTIYDLLKKIVMRRSWYMYSVHIELQKCSEQEYAKKKNSNWFLLDFMLNKPLTIFTILIEAENWKCILCCYDNYG